MPRRQPAALRAAIARVFASPPPEAPALPGLPLPPPPPPAAPPPAPRCLRLTDLPEALRQLEGAEVLGQEERRR